MKVKVYEKTDQDEVISLWSLCGLVVSQNNPANDIERKLNVDPDLFLVGVSGNEIVATVMGGYEGHRGWINYLAVKPTQQRKGYGEQMMLKIESLLKVKGCPKVNLQVRETNKNILAFYKAIGYDNDNVIGLGKRIVKD